MSNSGRPPVLDEDKKSRILDLLRSGCGKAAAARAVNCDPRTIAYTAKRDPQFADQLARAEHKSELIHLENINVAGTQPQYWRASAWFLERTSPDRFAKTNPGIVTQSQMTALVVQIAEIIIHEIPVAAYRKQVFKRFDAILRQLRFLTVSLPTGDCPDFHTSEIGTVPFLTHDHEPTR
jgi:hypothetical protein